MNSVKKRIIIISISSDIGYALAKRYLRYGWKVFGTYRTKSSQLTDLLKRGAVVVRCDLSDNRSIANACKILTKKCGEWDILLLAPGTQEPVRPFISGNFKNWEESIAVNFTGQMRITRYLLPKRKKDKLGPCVLYFAGGGTNNATINYSAYTISKIALIKMCELLDAEIMDTRFVIIGPGWVKTKIHNSTLKAGKLAGANYRKTLKKLSGNELTPMDKVLDCCDWLFKAPRKVVGGRNFSVVFDKWGSKMLDKILIKNNNMYKLRRYGNACRTQ